jgi:hypothetical protein
VPGRVTALTGGRSPETITAERLARMFAINVTGSFLCAREAVKRMSTKHGGKGGAIVNVSSAAAKLGSPGDYVDYAASKAAIETFTVGLAKEVGGEGIRVNCVRPGVIRTDIHLVSGDPSRVERIGGAAPLGRPGEPEEVARAILFLASDEASYTTGSVLDDRRLCRRRSRPGRPRAAKAPWPCACRHRSGPSPPTRAVSPAWTRPATRRWPTRACRITHRSRRVGRALFAANSAATQSAYR